MAIDFEKIRRDHPLEDVVEREVTSVPENRKICCPFHGETTPSLHVYPDGTWRCYGGGCGKGGDVLDFLAYLYHGTSAEGAALFDVLDRLGEIGATPISEEEKAKRYQSREAKRLTDEEQRRGSREKFFLCSLRSMQKVTDTHRDIFESWAINREWQEKARLGFDDTRPPFPSLIIPATFRGVTFGVKRRRLPALDESAPAEEPKYINLKWSSLGIYNADVLLTQPPSVVVCEDEKSALAICSGGGVAIATNGGATFWRGKNEKKLRWWLRWLSSVPQLYFWRDADEVGIPQWTAGKEYQAKDRVIAPNRGNRFFLKCESPGISLNLPPVGLLREGQIIEDGSAKWRVVPNPGLQCALDFRALFPRVEIVDSGPYKDASDALADGIDWREVIL